MVDLEGTALNGIFMKTYGKRRSISAEKVAAEASNCNKAMGKLMRLILLVLARQVAMLWDYLLIATRIFIEWARRAAVPQQDSLPNLLRYITRAMLMTRYAGRCSEWWIELLYW